MAYTSIIVAESELSCTYSVHLSQSGAQLQGGASHPTSICELQLPGWTASHRYDETI